MVFKLQLAVQFENVNQVLINTIIISKGVTVMRRFFLYVGKQCHCNLSFALFVACLVIFFSPDLRLFAQTNPSALFYDGFEDYILSSDHNSFLAKGWVNNGSEVNNTTIILGNWTLKFNLSDSITKGFDTTGFQNIKLQYKRMTKDCQSSDRFYAEWSNNGSVWTTLENISGNKSLASKTFTLPSAAANNPNFKIRFRTSYNGSTPSAYLDEVKIIGVASVQPVDVLVVVPTPLYNKQGVGAAISTYLNDLSQEGWITKLIKVNEVSDGSSLLVRNPDELKRIIRQYYSVGLKGFVLIGSEPYIPVAQWTPYHNYLAHAEDEYKDVRPYWRGAIDVFYADMNSHWLKNEHGVFVSFDQDDKRVDQYYSPELFWGRISPGVNVDLNLDQEALLVISYLNKIHNYRTIGDNLEYELQEKALVFSDDDWFTQPIDKFTKHFNEIRHIYEHQTTTPQKLLTELSVGGEAAMLSFHSGFIETEDLMTITPKFHYLNLSSCGAAALIDVYGNPSSNPAVEMMFGSISGPNDYVYNITVPMVSVGIWIDQEFVRKMSTEGVGYANKKIIADTINARNVRGVAITLLGDPTLKYRFTEDANTPPSIEPNLTFLTAKANEMFEHTLTAVDAESDPVSIQMSLLQPGSTFDPASKKLTWIPSIEQTGFKLFSAKAADSQNNKKYSTDFSIKVNPGFMFDFEDVTNGIPNGWNITNYYGNASFTADGQTSKIGSYSSKIQATSGSSLATHRKVDVATNTTYRVTAYVKTSGLINSTGGNTGASVSVTSISSGQLLNSFQQQLLGTNDWTQISFDFDSEDNTRVRLNLNFCGSSQQCQGTAWFDAVTISPINTPWVFLSNIPWQSANNGTIYPVQKDLNNLGNLLQIREVTYIKGLGVEAPSEVVYNLGGNYTRFVTDMGLDNAGIWNPSIRFEVIVDGQIVCNSGQVDLNTPPITCDITVSGKQTLTLKAYDDTTPGKYGDYANWAGARLLR